MELLSLSLIQLQNTQKFVSRQLVANTLCTVCLTETGFVLFLALHQIPRLSRSFSMTLGLAVSFNKV